MGALCVANKKNLAVRNEQVAVKCRIIPFNSQAFISYFKSHLTFKEIKAEIAKKLKKEKKLLQLEVKGIPIKYEHMQLSYMIGNKLDEIDIKVIENSSFSKPESNVNPREQNNLNNIKEQREDFLNKFNSTNSKQSNFNNLETSDILDEQSIAIMSKFCDLHYINSSTNVNNNYNNTNSSSNLNINTGEKDKERDKKKLTMICQTCGQGICEFCLEEYHKDHVIVKKIDIIGYNKLLIENQDTINQQINEMKLSTGHTELIKNFRVDIKKFSELFYKMIDEMKKKESELIESYKNNVNAHLPFLLCYRDNLMRVNKEYEKNLNNIIADDKTFMQYYLDYLLLSNQVVKSAENIGSLKFNLAKYKSILEDYQLRTSSILEVIKENYSKISRYLTDDFDSEFPYQYSGSINKYDNNNEIFKSTLVMEKDFNGNKSPNNLNVNPSNKSPSPKKAPNNNSNNPNANNNYLNTNITSALNKNNNTVPKNRLSLKDLIQFQSKNLSTNNMGVDKNYYLGGNSSQNQYALESISANKNDSNKKINLKSLMEMPNKMISGLIKKQKRKKTMVSQIGPNEGQIILDPIDEFNVTGKEINPEFICNIEDGSNCIYMFKCQEGTITRQQCQLKNCGISKFEAHHSCLNYKNRFYVSGSGLGSMKSFLQLDVEDDFSMKKLPDMLSSHSFHGMLGVLSSIWVISGTMTTKVEKFNLDNQTWSSLPSLHYARTWPSSIYVENQGVFVFGGLVDPQSLNNNSDNDNENKVMQTSEYFTLKIEKLDVKTIIKYFESDYQNQTSQAQTEETTWELLTINFEKSYLPIFSGFVLIFDNSVNDNSGNIIIFGGKSNLDDYESEDKVLNLDLQTLTVKEESFVLEVPDEFDGRSFVKFTKLIKKTNDDEDDNPNIENASNIQTCYAQFSSCVPKRLHIYSNNKMEIIESSLLTQSSYKSIK